MVRTQVCGRRNWLQGRAARSGWRFVGRDRPAESGVKCVMVVSLQLWLVSLHDP